MRPLASLLFVFLLAIGARAEVDEPFGFATVPDPQNRFAQHWQGVQRQWAVERGILHQCRADLAFCAPAAQRFLQIIDDTRALSGRIRLAHINRAINLTIKAKDDVTNYGVGEIWTTPLATLANGAGDCTDYAIAKYYLLGEVGIAENDRRLLIVSSKNPRDIHAVLAVRAERRWLILDNKTLAIVDAGDSGYAPLLEFTNRGRPAVCGSRS